MAGAASQLLICLLAAHAVGDFTLQTDGDTLNKRRMSVLARHAAILAALSYVLAGLWTDWRLPAAVFVTHGLIDRAKSALPRESLPAFLADQAAHLLVLAGIALWLGRWQPAGEPFWAELLGRPYLTTLVTVAGGIVAVRAVGFAIAIAVQPLLAQIAQAVSAQPGAAPRNGLRKGGQLIGQWERALIFIFVLAGYPAGIGLLIAAKSVFRFGELKEARQRMEAEYIIVGTLMSFGLGAAAAFLTRAAIQHL